LQPGISFPGTNELDAVHSFGHPAADGIPRYSAFAVIATQAAIEQGTVSDFAQLPINPETLAGKIVIIGTSAAATHDTKITPYGAQPGVLLHATLMSNLLEDHTLRFIPDWIGWVALILFNLGAAYSLLLSPRSAGLRIFLPALVLIVFALAALSLFKLSIVFPLASLLVGFPPTFLAGLGILTFTEGREKRKYSKILNNMVDPGIVGKALEDLDALKRGGEMRITAFFSDVAGFSTISEELSAGDLARLLNEYLSAMTQILKKNYGTLDKYIGDAIVGIFGAPVGREQTELEAAQAALQMIAKLSELRAVWQATNAYSTTAQNMQIRIGLNSGLAKVGFMGTDELASYTMMGDTVNLAARLEAAAKDYGVDILISESTREAIKERMVTRILDRVVVKGKTAPVEIYELVGEKSAIRPEQIEPLALFEEGFAHYLRQNWNEAIAYLERSERLRGRKDKAARLLITRIGEFRLAPPPPDWNGAYVRTHK